MVIRFWPHYKTEALPSMEALRQLFPQGKADALNWCLASTSGVHGSYATIDEIERRLTTGRWDEDDDETPTFNPTEYLTVLVIQPRLVTLRYGHIPVTLEDLPWLRAVIASTLEEMAKSQIGNLAH